MTMKFVCVILWACIVMVSFIEMFTKNLRYSGEWMISRLQDLLNEFFENTVLKRSQVPSDCFIVLVLQGSIVVSCFCLLSFQKLLELSLVIQAFVDDLVFHFLRSEIFQESMEPIWDVFFVVLLKNLFNFIVSFFIPGYSRFQFYFLLIKSIVAKTKALQELLTTSFFLHQRLSLRMALKKYLHAASVTLTDFLWSQRSVRNHQKLNVFLIDGLR